MEHAEHRPLPGATEVPAAEPPFGAAVFVYRRRTERIEFLVLHRALDR
jgi:hypothetical protein